MNTKIEISPYGNMLVYKKGYTAEFAQKEIKKNKLSGLRIFDHLDVLDSLDFLVDFTFLEKLDIDCIKDHDYSFLKKLVGLKSLGIGISTKERNIIDLSNQINLENLTIKWRKGKIMGLDQCINIKSLCLIDYIENDFTPISSLFSLKDLKVKTGTLHNFNGLDKLLHLKSILIGNCKKLGNLHGLGNLSNLNSLSFEQCSGIKNYDEIGKLYDLENLQITDCNEIESIRFIEGLYALKKLSLLGNTNVLDGDLLPAKRVKQVFYKHRKHYNTKIENKEYDIFVKNNLNKIKRLFN